MQHTTDPSFTAAEVAVEAGGVRITLRAESSLQDLQAVIGAPLDASLSHEFSGLVQRALPALHEGLLLAHRQFSETLQVAYNGLLREHTESISAALRTSKRRAK